MMEEYKLWADRLKYLLVGALAVFGTVFLTGMSNNDGSLPYIGRYQVSAWGASGGYGAFVTDTATGETKNAYVFIYGKSDDKKALKDNLGKAFDDIK